MKINTKNWLYLILGVVAVLVIVVFARNDLFLGSALKRFSFVTKMSKPLLTQPKENVKQGVYQIQRNRLCGEGSYTVTNTSDPPPAPYNPREKGIILGKFTVTTKNCELPIRTIWFDWRTRQFEREAYHVYLASIETYPMGHFGENDYMYRYADTLNECMDNPDIGIAGRGNVRAYRVPLSPFSRATTILPNTSVQFGMKADFRPKINEDMDEARVGTAPSYIVSVDRAFGAVPIGNPLDLQTISFNPPNSPVTDTCIYP